MFSYIQGHSVHIAQLANILSLLADNQSHHGIGNLHGPCGGRTNVHVRFVIDTSNTAFD